MVRVLFVLCLLPCIVLMGPLPRQAAYPYGHEHAHQYGQARMDEKLGQATNENFLNAFLGNVHSSEASANIKPLIKDTERTKLDKFDKDSTKTKSDDKDDYVEDDFGYNDGYGNDHYEEDDYDHDKEDHYYKASINCREFHMPHATTPRQCAKVKREDIEPDFVLDADKPKAEPFCRWDVSVGDKGQQAGCLCPRTNSKCYKEEQCYWYTPKGEKSKHGYEEDNDEKDDGQCIHNSERFYNILANLLSKRGKKDFAIKIKYSSAAAKSDLPYGPWGPHILHHDEPYRHPYGDRGYGIHGDGYGNEFDYGYINSPQYYPDVNQGYTSYGSPYGSQGHVGYPQDIYQNAGGYFGYPQDIYQNVGGYSPGANANQGYTNYGTPYDTQGHVGYPQGYYQNVGGYSPGANVNQDYTNYGTPYDSQRHVGYPQDVHQNVGGYSPGVNNPSSYHSTAGPVSANGPYADEIVQNPSQAYLPNHGANSYVSNSAPEYQISPLVTEQARYESPILESPGYRENVPYSVPTSINNYANGGGATYNPTYPSGEPLASNYGNVAFY